MRGHFGLKLFLDQVDDLVDCFFGRQFCVATCSADMAATAKGADDLVDIDIVIGTKTDLVFAVDGVEEDGDFGSTDFAEGVYYGSHFKGFTS